LLTVVTQEQDERLLIEAAQKDPSRFAELYENHFDRVYAFIASRVRNRELAQDLTSDVFHQALAKLKQFEWRGIPFSAWLMRIAANAITDHARKAVRERGNPSQNSEPSTPPDQTQLDEIERRATLFRMVGSLPEDQQRVIALRFGEQRSIREIAQQLQRTEGAIKQLQFRAIQTLRTRMREQHG
jgi:RNA polymerase sigma-70 factor, ECF subfamily